MIIEILIIIAVIYLLIGSYTDLKTREVPDIVNFSFIALAFGVNLSLSVIYSDWSFIVSSINGIIVVFPLSVTGMANKTIFCIA